MADGFLSRWSKRKAGKEDDLVEQPKETPQILAPASTDAETKPPASLEDVEKIDRFDPDFSAFMKPDVDPAVQQAALKKMFTDPHFNKVGAYQLCQAMNRVADRFKTAGTAAPAACTAPPPFVAPVAAAK